MKILFISNGFPPRQWAGTETYTAGIAQELDRQGHQVQVLCGGDWQEGPEYWNGYTDEFYQNIPVRRLNFNWTKAPDPNLISMLILSLLNIYPVIWTSFNRI